MSLFPNVVLRCRLNAKGGRELSFLTWPLVGLVLGVLALVLFRQPLSRFLDRAQKIGTTGIEASPLRQEAGEVKPSIADKLLETYANVPQKPGEVKSSPANEFLKVFDNALLVKREDQIREELKKRNIQGADRERVLLRFLAALVLVGEFDRVYVLIWGSQIGALQEVNAAGANGINIERLQAAWYEDAAKREPETYRQYSFDQWLGFLVESSLITRDAQKVTIRPEGREFLRYVIERGYSIFKRA